VVAGPGVTVDGNGSPTTPYIISTGAATPTALQATDTATVDTTVTGTGTAADPYVVSAAVVLDPAPPGGGTQLLQVGPDGLYLECEQVRGCISAGDGTDYDPTTGVISVQVSGDAGNTTTIGGDGGIYTPAASTALAAMDSATVDVEITGTGTAGDPYEVTADVILDPAPPGGGTQLLQAGPDGLYLECEQVRGCLIAGDGITYDPATGEITATGTALQATDTNTVNTTLTGTGTPTDPYVLAADVIVAPEPNGLEATANGLLVAPSADAGNQLTMGTDGRLMVPPDPPLETGCGLAGDGTAAAPLVVVPAAGSEAWPWACDVAVESTLKCDPATGELWTPPEHYSAQDHIYVEHFLGGWLTPIGPTGGWAIIDPGANQAFNIPANFLGNNCRPWGYEVTNSVTWDITHSADAVFELGMVVQQDGGAFQVRPMWGHLTAVGQAHRERGNGTANETLWNIPAGSGASCIMLPAIRVVAGQVTAIHSWVSDATIDTQTNTP
jgi:hypothetical protein